MSIETFPLGPLETNCHVVINGSDAVAVDPGGDLNGGLGEVLALLKERQLTLRAILCTHYHFDHLYGVAALHEATGAPVYGGYVTPADGDEWAWVRENVPGAAEVDVSRLPRQGMLQVLRDTVYGSVGIPEGLAPQGWTYWDETDCWYHAHGDTGIYSVALLSGQWTGEGTGTLRFQGLLGQTYQISFTLGQTEQDAGHLYLRACVSAD